MPPSSSGQGHFPFTEKTGIRIPLEVLFKVGIIGFEPMTFCFQNRHATKLRYIPSYIKYYYYNIIYYI
jgi:hypothetical protein